MKRQFSGVWKSSKKPNSQLRDIHLLAVPSLWLAKASSMKITPHGKPKLSPPKNQIVQISRNSHLVRSLSWRSQVQRRLNDCKGNCDLFFVEVHFAHIGIRPGRYQVTDIFSLFDCLSDKAGGNFHHGSIHQGGIG